MKKLDVLIIDDHLMVAQAWKMILQSHDEFNEVHHCGSADEALSILETFKPDVILLDVNLPRVSGIEAIPTILAKSPNSKIIGLSIYALPVYVKKMMGRGAQGYLTKSSTSYELLEAIKAVMKGQKYICSEIRDVLAANLIQLETLSPADIDKLTAREREVIGYLKQELTSKEISHQMCISPRTVEVYRYNILRKLNLNNTAALLDFVHNNDPLI